MLFKKFRLFIDEKKLIPDGGKVLLAASGGVDSSVMMHLFYRLSIPCEVAHCNFQLRGAESDGDETFVRDMAACYNFPVFVTRFETEEYAEENKLSIQMAARELRYTWFSKLAQAHGCKRIAIAHNRDDAMETFFINLERGSGIGGLTGMRYVAGNIIRPLLFASRNEINEYCHENQLDYREDSSNLHDKYLRNYIRHNIIPAFEKVTPHFRDSLTRNLERLNDAHVLYQHALTKIIPDLISNNKGLTSIDIPMLLDAPAPKTVLFEILKNFGFSAPLADEIFTACKAVSGKQFFSTSHWLIKDRDKFIISKRDNTPMEKYYIEEHTLSILEPIHMELQYVENSPGFSMDKSVLNAYLDANKLTFPLILRKWQQGDYFCPLGMRGLKKVSDFFIDLKLSIIDKEKTWLLLSADKIVWIVGKRIDDRFKIDSNTRTILIIKAN